MKAVPMVAAGGAGGIRGAVERALPLLVWACHVCLVMFTFPVSELLTPTPLMLVDAPFHQYQMDVARELWESRRLAGYDPWFAAGHIGGVSYNASAKVPALVAMLFPALDVVVIYKLFVFIASVVAPGFLWLACRWVSPGLGVEACATLLGCLAWWISGLHWYHTAGMVAFVLASYAAVPYVIAVLNAARAPVALSQIAALSAAGGGGLLLHPLFPVPVIVVGATLAVAHWREIRWTSAATVLLVVPIACVLPNLPWVVELIRNPGWADNTLSPFQKAVDIGMVWREAIGEVGGPARGARLNPVLLVCTLWMLLSAESPPVRRWAAGLAAGAAALALLAAVGAAFPWVSTLQPNRLSATAYLVLVLTASAGVVRIAQGLSAPGFRRTLARGTCVFLACAGTFFAGEMVNEVTASDKSHHGAPPPLVRGEGERTRWLVEWIRSNTTGDARILFETSSGRVHDGGHISAYLASRTRREFIGGPYVHMHHAGFWDGFAFGAPLREMSGGDLQSRLELYNIGWIIVFTEEAKRRFDKVPGVMFVAQHAGLHVYRTGFAHGFFAEGRGNVSARRLNRLELEGVSGHSIVLKYHYVTGMVAEPGGKVEPVWMSGDPAPFIRVIDPPPSFAVVLP